MCSNFESYKDVRLICKMILFRNDYNDSANHMIHLSFMALNIIYLYSIAFLKKMLCFITNNKCFIRIGEVKLRPGNYDRQTD